MVNEENSREKTGKAKYFSTLFMKCVMIDRNTEEEGSHRPSHYQGRHFCFLPHLTEIISGCRADIFILLLWKLGLSIIQLAELNHVPSIKVGERVYIFRETNIYSFLRQKIW